MKRASLILAALALLFGCVSQAKADFVNGSFETGDLTGWSGTATTDGYGLNPFGTTYGSGFDGKYWMWLGGHDTLRSLEQTVTGLTSGATYEVDFIMASEVTLSDSLFVSVDGGTPVQFTAPPMHSTFWDNWVSKEFTFTATGSSATIEFSTFGINPSSQFDVGLDNVSLHELASAAPAPSGLALCSTALFTVLGYFGWRRRKLAVA